ncbi:hypothetical protein TrispH2_002128 [Trichoplax sp. H2]|nr:hypothetical protein TrispH2_002128 [Trichoplax sp. H2]|eukprot:RDD45768.1 hypothetical protein TrispH2_002128 [Trichoplax sp. H2]
MSVTHDVKGLKEDDNNFDPIDSDVDSSSDISGYFVLNTQSSLDSPNISSSDITHFLLNTDDKAIISDADSYCLVDDSTLTDVDQDTQCSQIEASSNSDNKSEKNESTIIAQADEAVELTTDNDTTSVNQIVPDVMEADSNFLSESEMTEPSGIIPNKSALIESINQNKKVVTIGCKKELLAPSSYTIIAVIVCLISMMIMFPMFQGSSKHIIANEMSLKCENDTHNVEKPSDICVTNEVFLQKHFSVLIYNINEYVECLRHEVGNDPLNKCNALLQKFADTNYYNKTKYNLATQKWIDSIENELSKLTKGVNKLLIQAKVERKCADKTWLEWITGTSKNFMSWVTGTKENNKNGIKNNTEPNNNSWLRRTGSATKTWLTWISEKSKNIINWRGPLGASSSPSSYKETIQKDSQLSKHSTPENRPADKSERKIDADKIHKKDESSRDFLAENKHTSQSWLTWISKKSKKATSWVMGRKKGMGYADKFRLSWLMGKSKDTTNILTDEKKTELTDEKKTKLTDEKKTNKNNIQEKSEPKSPKTSFPTNGHTDEARLAQILEKKWVVDEKTDKNGAAQKSSTLSNHWFPRNSLWLRNMGIYYNRQMKKAYSSINRIFNKAKEGSKKIFRRG